MPKKPLPDTPSVSIFVRGDVAVLTFGMGSASDQACAATIQGQVYGNDHSKPDRDTIGNWGPDSSYLFREQLFVHADKSRILISALKQRGHWVEAETYTNWPQSSLGTRAASSFPGNEHRIVERVHQQPWGQIIVPPTWIAGIVVELAHAYSDESILVVAKNNSAVRGLVRQLKQQTIRKVTHGNMVDWQQQPLVHVQALSGLDRASHDWQVLIFADAESARSDTGMRVATSMPHAAIYALNHWQQKLDSEDQLRIRVVSGPELYRLIDGPVDRGIVTVFRVPAKRLRKGVPRNPLMRKRCHIWRNERRNQQVAGLATAFANGDQRQLMLCSIPVSTLRQQLAAIGARPRVAVIAENVEHARALREYLPEWRLAIGMRPADIDLPQLPMDEDRVIVTLTRARAAGVVADVILRADGSEQGWRWDYGPHYGLNRASMIVVDFMDGFDARSRECWQSRRMDYQRRGWSICAVSHPKSQITYQTTSDTRRDTFPAKREGGRKELDHDPGRR